MCTACHAICPVDAINMIPDEEGFEYPVIYKDKCSECYQCIRVCPFKIKEYRAKCVGDQPQ